MALKNSAPLGTRFPNFGDEEIPFELMEPLRGRVEFGELLAYHSPSEQKFTLLGLHEARVTGAASFSVSSSDLFVDYLSRNALFKPPAFVAAGSVLIAALENVADQLGIGEIRLESVDFPKTLEWYTRQGFVPEGPPRHDVDWDTLIPMVKVVEPIGGL